MYMAIYTCMLMRTYNTHTHVQDQRNPYPVYDQGDIGRDAVTPTIGVHLMNLIC